MTRGASSNRQIGVACLMAAFAAMSWTAAPAQETAVDGAPVDPVIEEPIRPLFPGGEISGPATPANGCGAIDAFSLCWLAVCLGVAPFARSTACRRR